MRRGCCAMYDEDWLAQVSDIERFDGETFNPPRDGHRLSCQLEGVRLLMADRRWRTLGDIAAAVNGSEAGVSARLRDLRKTRFGGYQVERRHVSAGLWEYRVLPPVPSGQQRLGFEA